MEGFPDGGVFSGQARQGLPMTLGEKLAPLLARAVAEGVVAGAVAAVVSREDTLALVAAGRLDATTAAPMTPDTLFALASLTKPVVSMAALQLVEQQRLALDAPVAELLGALAQPMVLEGFDAEGAPRLRPARRPITLRHLLTHTAGYGYPEWSPGLAPALAALGLGRVPRNFDQLARTPLLFDPGTRWNYGISLDVVGLLVEAASRQSLARYLREHIFLPLGLESIGFTVPPAQQPRMARVHQRDASGVLRPIAWPAGQGQGFTGGGGGLCGSVVDYARLLRLLLAGGALDGVRLLREATVGAMGSNQIGALEVSGLGSCLPELSADADFFPGMVKKWGYGFLINTEPGPHGRRAGSLCWGGITNVYCWLDPASGLAGCLFAQQLPFADPAVLALLGAVEAAAYAA